MNARAWLLTALLLTDCGGAHKPAAEPAAGAPVARDDRAVRLFVDGAEQLARGTPKSLARAAELLREALRLSPALWEAHYDLGLVYRKRGELDAARAELAEAARLAPDAHEPLWALAECELARGERERAAALLEQLLSRAPERVELQLALAAIERERGRREQALGLARAVLIKNPKETRALLELGRIYRAHGEYDVSELVLEKARALTDKSALASKSAPVYNELGLLALARGDTQLAFTHFAKAESLDPSFLPAHVNQGSVLLRAGDYGAAERAYRAALPNRHDAAPSPNALEAQLGLGIALRGQGKYREARATYEKVLEAHPAHPAALYDLAVLLADFLDQRKQAIPFFERYLAAASKTDSHRASAERYLEDIRMSSGSGP